MVVNEIRSTTGRHCLYRSLTSIDLQNYLYLCIDKSIKRCEVGNLLKDFSVIPNSYLQVWAEDGDGDDWRCVQTLAEPGRYVKIVVYCN